MMLIADQMFISIFLFQDGWQIMQRARQEMDGTVTITLFILIYFYFDLELYLSFTNLIVSRGLHHCQVSGSQLYFLR